MREPGLEGQSVLERLDAADASRNPREEVVTLEDFPGDARELARLLEPRVGRSHSLVLPGRCCWIIRRGLVPMSAVIDLSLGNGM